MNRGSGSGAPGTVAPQANQRFRILAILNGSERGFSGGDFHTVAVLNELAVQHDVELYLPSGSSPELINILSQQIRSRRSAHSRPLRTRWGYLLQVMIRTLTASWFVISGHRRRWDIVIANSHFIFDVVPILFAPRGASLGVYWWHHATAAQVRPAWTTVLVNASETVVAKLASLARIHLIVGNSGTRQWLLHRGVPADLVNLTSNGPSFLTAWQNDEDAFRQEPFLRNLQGTRFVLFCARLSNLKGAADLPIILRNIVEAAPNTKVAICGGESPESPQLHRALESLEMEGTVKFMGFASGPLKNWLFQRAHVVLAPSYEEGWGITVSDGLLGGSWVVAYDLPAVREAFPEGPIFVPLGDVGAFSEAVVRCLAQPRPLQHGDRGDRSWFRIAQADLAAIHGSGTAFSD
jgi:glycosyltransferase involved in cell wall biosynthesis